MHPVTLRLLAALGLLSVATPAFAAPDVRAAIAGPSGTYVYQSARYTVTVSNTGNQTANNTSVVIQLPRTHTSPTVYTLGTLGARSASCTLSAQTLTCSLGNLRRATSASVYFDFALPENTDALSFTATAATTSGESSTANNVGTLTPALNNYVVSFAAPRTVLNTHCTGTSLTSYYECTLFPSSLSSHEAVFEAGGGVSIVGDTGGVYTGAWTQDTPDHLAFSYLEYGILVAEFEGYGVSATCWEGLTTFPGSSYVSPYRVCLE